jgi:hypothetical protein
VPYFVYKVLPARQYECVSSFEKYRDARTVVRDMRGALREQDNYSVRIVHAAGEGEAMRLLSEKREPPPLGEDG